MLIFSNCKCLIKAKHQETLCKNSIKAELLFRTLRSEPIKVAELGLAQPQKVISR